MNTCNADTPLAHRKKPLLTIDVGEHAYSLDHQNRRDVYIRAYLDHLVNWQWAARQLAGSQPGRTDRGRTPPSPSRGPMVEQIRY